MFYSITILDQVRVQTPGSVSEPGGAASSLAVPLTQQPVGGHLTFALDEDVAAQLQLETVEVLQDVVSFC